MSDDYFYGDDYGSHSERESVELKYGLSAGPARLHHRLRHKVFLQTARQESKSFKSLNIFRYLLEEPPPFFLNHSLNIVVEYDRVVEKETNYSAIDIVNYNINITSDMADFNSQSVELIKSTMKEDVDRNEAMLGKYYNPAVKDIVNKLARVLRRNKELVNYMESLDNGVSDIIINPAYIINYTKQLKSIIDEPVRVESAFEITPHAMVQALIFNDLEEMIIEDIKNP